MSSMDPGSHGTPGARYRAAFQQDREFESSGADAAGSEVPSGTWPDGSGSASSAAGRGPWPERLSDPWPGGDAGRPDSNGPAWPGGDAGRPDHDGPAWLGGDTLAGLGRGSDRAVPTGADADAAGRDSSARRRGEGAALPAVRLSSLPRRRRPGMIALAFALVGAGVLASATLYQRVDRQVPVLLVTAPVPAGEVVSAADLGTATVAAGPGIRLIPAGQLPRVVGLVAAGPLQPGTLLAPSELTSALPPAVGQVIVPVPVKPSMLPASGLASGDQVEVVPVAGAQPAALGRPVSAVVQAVTRTPDQDGSDVIDLLVASRSGPALARQAASGQLALVVTHRGR